MAKRSAQNKPPSQPAPSARTGGPLPGVRVLDDDEMMIMSETDDRYNTVLQVFLHPDIVKYRDPQQDFDAFELFEVEHHRPEFLASVKGLLSRNPKEVYIRFHSALALLHDAVKSAAGCRYKFETVALAEAFARYRDCILYRSFNEATWILSLKDGVRAEGINNVRLSLACKTLREFEADSHETREAMKVVQGALHLLNNGPILNDEQSAGESSPQPSRPDGQAAGPVIPLISQPEPSQPAPSCQGANQPSTTGTTTSKSLRDKLGRLPSEEEMHILEELDGKEKGSKELCAALGCCHSTLFTYIKPLKEKGIVVCRGKSGFHRPDASPDFLLKR